MTDFDDKLHSLLNADDEAKLLNDLEHTSYHAEMLASFKGPGSGLRIGVWIGVAVACIILFYCLWHLFHAEQTSEKIIYATFAIMATSAQIALKNWFNQRLNRRALMLEIRRLRLDVARGMSE